MRPLIFGGLFTALLLPAHGAFALEGDLDTSFGGSPYPGATTIAFDQPGSALDDRATAITASGSGYLLAGTTSTLNGGLDIAVTRIDARGQIDTSFADDGKVVIAVDRIAGGDDRPNSIAVDPMGRIVIGAGAAGTNGVVPVVIRLGSNGVLDTSWGPDGIAVISGPGVGFTGQGAVAAVRPDSTVVVAAAASAGGSSIEGIFLTRIITGTITDTTFGISGRQLFYPSAGSVTSVNGLAIGDSRIHVCGGTTSGGLVRWVYGTTTLQGTMPAIAEFDINQLSSTDQVNNVCRVVQPSRRFPGRTYLGGGSRTSTRPGVAVVAVTSAAANAYDNTFSDDGRARFVFDPAQTRARLEALIERDSGAVLVGGSVLLVEQSWEAYAMQLSPNGLPDTAFSPGGFRFYSGFKGGGAREEHFSGVVETAGRPVFAGNFQFGFTDPGDFDFAAVALASEIIFANGFE